MPRGPAPTPAPDPDAWLNGGPPVYLGDLRGRERLRAEKTLKARNAAAARIEERKRRNSARLGSGRETRPGR